MTKVQNKSALQNQIAIKRKLLFINIGKRASCVKQHNLKIIQ